MRFGSSGMAYSNIVIAFLLIQSIVNGQEINFAEQVLPILENNCLHCHNQDESESGLRLDSRAYMLRGGDSGLAAIVPGEPGKSYLMEVITHADEDMAMPPDEDKLDEEDIDLIRQWIAQGANWPGQMDAVIKDDRLEHWSFQPVTRPDVPAGEASPVDAFLKKQLTASGLDFSAPAEPLALIRRASIVLTGLTPTPEETSEFLTAFQSDADKAYQALVDRLLASPQFGERFAQHWLDVIRWAETNGSESNMYRKKAWVYRDWVVQAFNDDKPYDRFLFEQIAGDTVGQGEATGYLVAGPHVPVATVGQELAARRQARADRMDEILQTVGASAMGITIGCARCHNHKFDPVTIKDYYSMSAVFQDIEFGSRIPELEGEDPRSKTGQEIETQIASFREQLREFGPWEEHWLAFREIHFEPVITSAVRLNALSKSIAIDEFEVFGVEEPGVNLALASRGTKLISPKEMFKIGKQRLEAINDGIYGTEKWSALQQKGSDEKPWVEFEFTQPHTIDLIRISSNREDFFETDYLDKINKGNLASYRIEIRDEDGKWKPVASTPQYKELDQQHKARVATLKKIRKLIQRNYREGFSPSFVGRLIEPQPTHVLGRGSPENPREQVFASGIEVLQGDLGVEPNAAGNQRRVAFASWLASEKHPLTARVAVNRIWHHIFGQGIVTTTSDFGLAGAKPVNQELLDSLAADFTDPVDAATEPWSVKSLVRKLVLSKAFRQSSQPDAAALRKDGTSSLLWRYPPKRVEAEVIRDSILRASGCLDSKIGGKSFRIHNVKKRYAQWRVVDNYGPETWRRMLYQERMRRVDDTLFTSFDFPDCGQVKAKRPVSTTPLQALSLMNSDFVIDQSSRIAKRALEIGDGNRGRAVEACFELLLGRSPTDDEKADCVAVLGDGDLSLVCRALINSNEFAFVP